MTVFHVLVLCLWECCLVFLKRMFQYIHTHTHMPLLLLYCAQSCLTLCDSVVCSPPGSSVTQYVNPPIPCFWQPPMTMIGPQTMLDTGFHHSYFWTFAIINIVRRSSQGISKVGYTNNAFSPLYLLMLTWFLKCCHSSVQPLIWCSGVSPNLG